MNPDAYVVNDNKTIACLNGKADNLCEVPNRHPTKANSKFYKITGCSDCKYSDYCKWFMNNKDEDFKIFEVV